MGAKVNQTGNSKMYLYIHAGKIVLDYNKKEDLEEKIESMGLDVNEIQTRYIRGGINMGNPVFYYSFEFIKGMIDDIVISEPSWADVETLHIRIKEVGGEVFYVSLGDVFSSESKCFTRRLGNLDITKEVSFGAWQSFDNDKEQAYSGVRMYQYLKEVEYAINQDNTLYGVLTEFIKENFRFKKKPLAYNKKNKTKMEVKEFLKKLAELAELKNY